MQMRKPCIIKQVSNLRNILHLDMHIYPTPPLGQDMTQGQFLSGV